MAITEAYRLAHDSEFRLLAGLAAPTRAGRITALEPSGQVRVALDDADGGDVLAWPLNGFTYAVADVVYVLFAANGAESGVVVGSKAPLPTLAAAALPAALLRDGSRTLTADWDVGEGRRIRAAGLRARSDAGLRLEEEGGELGVMVADGGAVGIGKADPATALDVAGDVRLGTAVAPAVIEYADTSDVTNNEDKLGLRGPAYGGVACGALWLGRGSSYQNGRVRITYPQAGVETEALRLENGRMGVGTAAPQGTLHAQDGLGGLLFVTRANIGATAVTLIPDGSRDVMRGLAGLLVVSDGSSHVANLGTWLVGSLLDVAVGTLVLRLEVTAAGALIARRQSGTGTATLALLAVWL
jgi:hypothetical protein